MFAIAACGGGGGATADGEYPADTINLMAPADPGGGWDGTARAMQRAMREGGLTDEGVDVYNVGGAGGTIGLAQFSNDARQDPHELMVTGLVMLGAIETNKSPVDLSEMTPIASLTTEWLGIAVAADSPYQSMDDLLAAFKEDPRSIAWGGGSAGGADHILVGLIAQELGVDPSGVNYIAHAGGGEALAAILSGGVTVGVSGASEFADQVAAGQMRFLSISSDEPVEGYEAPPLTDSVDVSLSNWRGVVAGPGIDEEQQQQIVDLVEEMVETEEWQEAVEANRWIEFVQTGDEFGTFLEDERKRVTEVLTEIGLI